MKLTVFITTIGRPTLVNTLNSARQLCATDEVIVCVDGIERHVLDVVAAARLMCPSTVAFHMPRANDWGHTLRNRYARLASRDYLLFMDDDDCYAVGAIEFVRQMCAENAGKLIFFAMQRKGERIPRRPILEEGNVSTATGAVPNDPTRWGTWGRRYAGDFEYYQTCRFEVIWKHEHVIAAVRPHTFDYGDLARPYLSYPGSPAQT